MVSKYITLVSFINRNKVSIKLCFSLPKHMYFQKFSFVKVPFTKQPFVECLSYLCKLVSPPPLLIVDCLIISFFDFQKKKKTNFCVCCIILWFCLSIHQSCLHCWLLDTAIHAWQLCFVFIKILHILLSTNQPFSC